MVLIIYMAFCFELFKNVLKIFEDYSKELNILINKTCTLESICIFSLDEML